MLVANNMKATILFLLVIVPFFVLGQSQDVIWGGTTNKDDKKTYIKELVHHDDNMSLFLIKNDEAASPFKIIRYDKDLNPVGNPIDLDPPGAIMGNMWFPFKVFFHGDMLYVFYSGWIKEQKKVFLCYSIFDLKGTQLVERKEIHTTTAEGYMNSGNYEVAISPSHGFLSMDYQYPFDKDGNEKFEMAAFTFPDMDVISQATVTTTHEAERSTVTQLIADNSGNAFLIKQVKREKGNRHPECYVLGKGSKEIATQTLPMTDKHIIESRMITDQKSGQNFWVGTYNTPSGFMSEDVEGVFIVKPDASSMKLECNFKPLSKDILKEYIGQKQLAKPNPALDGVKILNVLQREDGKFYFLLEQTIFSSTMPSPSTGNARMTYNYRHNNVIAFLTDQQAETNWFNILKKRQAYSTVEPHEYFSSCISTTFGNKLYLVWNYLDRSTRLNVKPIGMGYSDDAGVEHSIPVQFGGMTYFAPFQWIVDSDGLVLSKGLHQSTPMESVFRAAPYEMAFQPLYYYNVGNGQTIVFSATPANNGVKYALGMLQCK